MRTLKFIVTNQIITKDPKCDFSGLVPGTEEYLQAEFSFSPEWNGCAKVVEFSSMMGYPYPPRILSGGTTCMIPAEALERRSFRIKVLGKKQGFKIATNKLTIEQDGGR